MQRLRIQCNSEVAILSDRGTEAGYLNLKGLQSCPEVGYFNLKGVQRLGISI